MSASPQAAIDQINKDFAARQAGGPAGPTPEQINAEKTAALAPVESAITAEQGMPKPPAPAQLPQTPKPIVDADDYSKLSAALVAMAMIAGSRKGNWLGAAASLNGAIKGHLEGNQDKADQEWKKYQADYEKAVEAHKEQQQEYLDVLNNKRLSINQKFDQWRMIAAKYDDQQMLALARQKHYDAVTAAIIGKDEHVATLEVNKTKVDEQRNKNSGGGKLSPEDQIRFKKILGRLAGMGATLPQGMRSRQVLHDTVEGLMLDNPKATDEEIVQGVVSGQLGMKERQAEMTVLAKREGNIDSAIMALNEKGGMYDQLSAAAKEVNFGDAKMANDWRLAAQGKVVANPPIQRLRNMIHDVQAEVVTVLSRSGVPSESVRAAAADMFPLDGSIPEIEIAIKTSKEVANAVASGNERVIEALKTGKSFNEALTEAQGGSPAHKPFADPKKEARYQEWKKTHAGAQ